MTRLKTGASARGQSFSAFKRLVRADLVLFHSAGLLRDLGLDEIADTIEEQRANIAVRLELHLDSAYARMAPSIRGGVLRGSPASSG